MQENSAAREDVRESGAGFSELDLALVEALQSAPRATWTQLGQALGVDATTVARRWERLRSEGLAWVTAYEPPRHATVAYVEVRCRARQFESVSQALTRLPWVFGVDETAGDFDLFLSVAATDLYSLGKAVHGTIGRLRGVVATHTCLGLTLFGEGSNWRTRAMEPASRALLPESGIRTHEARDTYSTHTRTRLGPQDAALRAALGHDGRLGYKELAAAIGMSEYTARRRLHRMLRDREITLRCDFAHSLAGYRAVALYRAVVPHPHLDQTGAALARMEQVRLCASVSGPHNLLVMVWVHDLDGISTFENHLADRFPHLEVKDRTLTLHCPKRMGRLLDPVGRAIGHVPLALPAGGGY
ncbi:Lrp/AsnC family transcriptional regulator [Streptomyces sp. NPDC058486]|uniref:Lrp/AsnC family transcriptional regulator n=1 Tax=unclassified Streptomyces TaxID=2593676 RepID=UPI00366A099A